MMRDKPIHSMDDLAGLKIRVASSSAAAIIEAYGATPVPMPANKVYTSMNTGVVDGALMGSDSLLIFKLIEDHELRHHQPAGNANDDFPCGQRRSIERAGVPTTRAALDNLTGIGISQRAAAGLAKFGEIAMGRFAAKEGAEIIVLSDKERAAFDAAAAGAVADLKAEFDAQGVPGDPNSRRDVELRTVRPRFRPGTRIKGTLWTG